VLVHEPNNPEATKMLGVLMHQSGRVPEALELLERATVLAPADADAQYNFGNALKAQGKMEQAIFCYRRATELNPKLAAAHYNLANALKGAGSLDQAIDAYQQALAVQPDHYKAVNNLGTALLQAGRIDEAIAMYQRAAALQPRVPDAFKNLGHAYRSAHQWKAAAAAFREALARDPRSAEIMSSLSMMLLLQGELTQGFAAHEARLALPQYAILPELAHRLWDGSELNGRRILLHSEQGFGDTIQFIRYVPMVKAKQGYCIVACQPVLRDLFRSMQGIDELNELGQVLPAFDVYCPLMSLPHRLHTTLETIPAAAPYLFADRQRSARWKETVEAQARGRMKIGLVWGATAGRGFYDSRSIPLELLEPLAQFQDSIAWFSVQKGPAAAQLDHTPPGLFIQDCGKDLRDFADTAALLDNLDLLISVDTSVAHLGGAMGRAVWLLLQYASDWRWMLDRSDSPWYPTMRIFRQQRAGDWTEPLKQVVGALRERTTA